MVDRAREYALSHLDEPLSILDLCNHIGASRRELQYCFQETLGINPVASCVRCASMQCVVNCANEHPIPERTGRRGTLGVWHLSRFSGDYRTLFGETPSQTLRRTQLC